MDMNMNTPMQNAPGMMPPKGTAPMETESSSSVGPAVGIVIIVIVIILGGLYFWGAKLDSDTGNDPLLDDAMSSSDEVKDIETDLNAVDAADLDSLDAELGNIDTELNTAP